MSKSGKGVQHPHKTNHHANQLNTNKGSSGTNPANAKVHGNRGKQLNPNQE